MARKLSIALINEKLEGTGIRLEQRGNKLNLRATLPNKSDSGKSYQRISLGLGTTPIELEQAEAQAWELHAQRVKGTFSWDKWVESDRDRTQPKSCQQLIDDYRSLRAEQGLHSNTWHKHYWTHYKHLPSNEHLTEQNILIPILRLDPNTKSRQEAVDNLRRLAEFAGLEVNLAAYRGNYSQQKVKPRKLPTDEQIEETRSHFSKIRTRGQAAKQWQWVYGVMAAYGVRDCEVHFIEIDFDPPYACKILKGKTGERIAYPLHPRWVEEWALPDLLKPQIKFVEPEPWQCGQAVTKALWKYLNEFPRVLKHRPYDLRHAYALRGATQYNIPARVMAGMMGHSIEVHLNTYSRWLNQSDVEKAYLNEIERVL